MGSLLWAFFSPYKLIEKKLKIEGKYTWHGITGSQQNMCVLQLVNGLQTHGLIKHYHKLTFNRSHTFKANM